MSLWQQIHPKIYNQHAGNAVQPVYHPSLNGMAKNQESGRSSAQQVAQARQRGFVSVHVPKPQQTNIQAQGARQEEFFIFQYFCSTQIYNCLNKVQLP